MMPRAYLTLFAASLVVVSLPACKSKPENRPLNADECQALTNHTTDVIVEMLPKGREELREKRDELKKRLRDDLLRKPPPFGPDCGKTLKKKHLDCAMTKQTRQEMDSCFDLK